jgi:hypothetical protein
MSKQRNRPGQIGSYWLSKKPRRDRVDENFHRTWYDERTRQTRRVSLGTPDFQAAAVKLAEWVVAHERQYGQAPDEVLIDTVLLNYWNDHAQHLASAKTARLNLSYWQEFWEGYTVADITPKEQAKFRTWLTQRGTGLSGIDRILSTGRAALNRAVKWQEVSSVPHIFGTLTANARRSRKPKGRPITPEELARLFNAVRSRHMMMFLLIASNTLARPAAILDLRPAQFDHVHCLLDLNPPDRAQNKKYRPIVPVTPTLLPWLELPVGPSDRYVSHRKKPIGSILHMWRLTREAAGLDERVTPYSVRHGMARELRKRRVPTEQIKLFLGHLPSGSDATTSIYAPYEPDFLADAIRAIEEVMLEVKQHLRRVRIDEPQLIPADPVARLPKPHPRSLDEAKSTLVRQLILGGVPHKEVVRQSGVGSGTVSKIRQQLKANVMLFRNTEGQICVPTACPNQNIAPTEAQMGEERDSYLIEKIGGPGRTRTCDNTVMSGAF